MTIPNLHNVKDEEITMTIGAIIGIVGTIVTFALAGAYMIYTFKVEVKENTQWISSFSQEWKDYKERGPRAQPQIDQITKENILRDARIKELEDKWIQNYTLLVQIATTLGVSEISPDKKQSFNTKQ